jgi:hypothetical protein
MRTFSISLRGLANCAYTLPPGDRPRTLLLLPPRRGYPPLRWRQVTIILGSARRPLRHLGTLLYRCRYRHSQQGPHKPARVVRSPRSPRIRASSRHSYPLRRVIVVSCLRAPQRHRRSWVHSLQVSSPSPRAFRALLPSQRVSNRTLPRNRRVSSQTLHLSRRVSSHRSRHNLLATVGGHRLGVASLAECRLCRRSLGRSRMGHLASYSPVSSLRRRHNTVY